MKTIKNNFRILSALLALQAAICVTSCSDDDDAPAEENDLEVITDVTLVFTNDSDNTDVVRARAQDPDGIGAQPLVILDEITLAANTSYTLTFEIFNNLDADDPEDIGEEILDEDNEHQFFFSFSDGAFTNPLGNGNIDTASDAIVYNDEDENGYPVGLNTSWTTAVDALIDRTFTVRLQHQPDIKTATTTSEDGDSDFNLEFVLNIR